jgi:hypothetical protein
MPHLQRRCEQCGGDDRFDRQRLPRLQDPLHLTSPADTPSQRIVSLRCLLHCHADGTDQGADSGLPQEKISRRWTEQLHRCGYGVCERGVGSDSAYHAKTKPKAAPPCADRAAEADHHRPTEAGGYSQGDPESRVGESP